MIKELYISKWEIIKNKLYFSGSYVKNDEDVEFESTFIDIMQLVNIFKESTEYEGIFINPLRCEVTKLEMPKGVKCCDRQTVRVFFEYKECPSNQQIIVPMDFYSSDFYDFLD